VRAKKGCGGGGKGVVSKAEEVNRLTRFRTRAKRAQGGITVKNRQGQHAATVEGGRKVESRRRGVNRGKPMGGERKARVKRVRREKKELKSSEAVSRSPDEKREGK